MPARHQHHVTPQSAGLVTSRERHGVEQSPSAAKAVPVAEPPLWIVSDAEGLILDVSPDAAHLLNASVRGLYQRSLILFFDRDRDHWQRALVRAALGERVIEAGLLRPKDRGPVPVGVAIQAVHDWTRPAVQWEFQRQ